MSLCQAGDRMARWSNRCRRHWGAAPLGSMVTPRQNATWFLIGSARCFGSG